MQLSVTADKRFLTIDSCSQEEYDQVKLSLTKKINNWRFHPLVKKGLWDGSVAFIKGKKIPSGLWYEVVEIYIEYKFEYNISGLRTLFDSTIEEAEIKKWALDFFITHELTPHNYQIETAYKILKYRRSLAELATSAGKSLINFLTIAHLLSTEKAKKVLVIVPNVSLVVQATEDFENYNQYAKIPLKIQQIYSGAKIRASSNVVIGTYQSLVKKESEYFKQFDVVSVDECHKISSVSIRKILDDCWHCDYRFGVSGTIPKKGTVERLTLMSNTGPVITNISANYLQEQGHISECQVVMIHMDYATDEQKEAFYQLSKSNDDKQRLFSLEQNFTINSKKRLDFITSIISKFKKNSLVLFYRIEHGEALFNALRQAYDGEVFYVDGNTDDLLRESYKKKMEEGDHKILVASYGTFSTGINIKNIHNIALTESFKSEVIIRQSIGRGLRKHADKDILTVIDFVDDLRYYHKGFVWKNYIFKHAESRKGIYIEQKFPFSIKNTKF